MLEFHISDFRIKSMVLNLTAPYITSFLRNTFRIFVGQKVHNDQCRADGFEVFLRAKTLHQIIAT